MDDLDLTPSERDAFAHLAATLGDDPTRLQAVRQRVRRRQRRRFATRAGLGVATAACAVAGGIVIVNRPGASPLQVSAASQPSEGATSAESATTVPTAACEIPGVTDAAAGTGAIDPAGPKVKVLGKVTAVTAATVTVHGEPGGSLSDITAGFAADAVYVDGGRKSTTRPTFAVGDAVGLEATKNADGSYSIEYIEVHVPDRPKSAAEADQPDPGAPDSTSGKAYGTVTTVTDSTLAVQAGPGVSFPNAASSIVAALNSATEYYNGTTKLTQKPAITVGQEIGVAFDAHADGTIVITSVQLDMTTTKPGGTDKVTPDDTLGKGYGTVTAVANSTITVKNSAEALAAGSPASVTATLTDATRYDDGDTKLTAKPSISVGDQVGFLYSVGKDGTTVLLNLDLHARPPQAADCANAKTAAEGKP